MPRSNRNYAVAVIPGDGIGKEVVPEGLRVLEAAALRYGFDLTFESHDFSSCDYYLQHGQMMPDDWQARLERSDAIFFGAVGWPAVLPDQRCSSAWPRPSRRRKPLSQALPAAAQRLACLRRTGEE